MNEDAIRKEIARLEEKIGELRERLASYKADEWLREYAPNYNRIVDGRKVSP